MLDRMVVSAKILPEYIDGGHCARVSSSRSRMNAREKRIARKAKEGVILCDTTSSRPAVVN